MIEQDFLECARTIGVDLRIAALLVDCDRALAEYPDGGDARWLDRLEDQRRRLLDPDLRSFHARLLRVSATSRC